MNFLFTQAQNIRLSAGFSDELDLLKMTDTSFLGRLLFGLQVTGIGLLIVFAMLSFLWGFLTLSGHIMQKMSDKKRETEEVESADIDAEPEYIAAEQEEVPESYDEIFETEEELAAVLAAAVAEYSGRRVSDFRVVSFRPRVR